MSPHRRTYTARCQHLLTHLDTITAKSSRTHTPLLAKLT
nr:MAG TPA: hypothetical protein [Caudoviricetes sp.]